MAIWATAVLILVLLILVLLAAIIFRTAIFKSKQPQAASRAVYPVNMDSAAGRLGQAVRFKTVSNLDKSQVDYGEFTRFHQFLEKSFPLVHSSLQKQVINDYALLYSWQGSDNSKKPVLLLAHHDVVPAMEEGWEQPPFSGIFSGGYIWGRGTLDNKASLLAILEAFEYLLHEGFKPACTIYLASGFDEEVGGREGAARIAEYFTGQKTQFEYVLDEGMVVTKGAVPGVPGWVALIGVAEKGYLTLELTAETRGGHSSNPPRQTSVGILAAAINRLQTHPFPARLTTPVAGLFKYIGPEIKGLNKAIFANLWLLSPVVRAKMASGETTAASVRTTIAPTMFQGSQQDNILPPVAKATINFRILPGESINSVAKRVRAIINDPRVKITPVKQSSFEPSPVSPISGPCFEMLLKTIHEAMPDVIAAPMIVLGRTDCTYFTGLSDCCYRFVPHRVTASEMDIIHGKNERVSLENYREMINFYIRLMQNSAGG